MRRLVEDQTLTCDAQSTPAAQLLAFTLWVRQFDLRQTRFWVRIPRTVLGLLAPVLSRDDDDDYDDNY